MLQSNIAHLNKFTWGVFLQEAADYLHVLVRISNMATMYNIYGLRYMESERCVEEELSSVEQLTYTRELHKIAPLWVEVRRRIICAKDVSQQMINHPFFAAIGARHSIESYLIKTIQALEDHVIRSNELTEETNVLISLVQTHRPTSIDWKVANQFYRFLISRRSRTPGRRLRKAGLQMSLHRAFAA